MTIFPEPPIFPNKTCRNDSMNLSSRHLSLSVVEASKALGQPHFVLQIFAAKLLDVLREKYSVDLPCTFSIDFLRTYIGLWSGGWCCLFSPSFQHKTDKQSQRQGLRVYQIPSAELFGNVFLTRVYFHFSWSNSVVFHDIFDLFDINFCFDLFNSLQSYLYFGSIPVT